MHHLHSGGLQLKLHCQSQQPCWSSFGVKLNASLPVLVDWSRSAGPGQQEGTGPMVIDYCCSLFSPFCKWICFTCWWRAVSFVDLDTGFLAFARQLMNDFLRGGVFALEVCNLEVFHLFLQHGCFVWFVGLFQIGIELPPSYSRLLWLGDQIPSFGFTSLHFQLDSLVSHPTWQNTWLTFANDFLSYFRDNMLKLLVPLGYW